MKMIFLGDAARDSGSFGFSEACPLKKISHVQSFACPASAYHPAHTACTFIRSAMSTINSTLA